MTHHTVATFEALVRERVKPMKPLNPKLPPRGDASRAHAIREAWKRRKMKEVA